MKLRAHLINKIIELLKFIFTLAFIALLIIKAPNEATQVIGLAVAFILGNTNKAKALMSQ